MEKEISRARARQLQITLVIVSILGVFLMWPLDQVRAATVERVLAPYEILDEGKSWLVADLVGNGSDATPYLDPVNLGSSRGMLNQHGLFTMLPGTQRSEGNYALFAPDFGAIESKKSNAIEKQGEMAASRAAKILEQYPHGDRTAGLHIRRPVFDQADSNHRTSRAHSFLEFGALKFLSIGSNGDSIHRSIGAALHEYERDDQDRSASNSDQYTPKSVERRFFGPFSGVPLSAQIAVAIFLTLAAWPLYRPFKICIDKSLAVDGPAAWVFVILAIAGLGCWLGSVTYVWASATYGIL